MSTTNARLHVIDENGNTYNVHQQTSIPDVEGLQTALDSKANVSAVTSGLAGKVDKETGKGLSTNDYTTTEKNKLAGIETQANKTVVDDALSSTSTNPVQNKVVNAAITSLKNYITPQMFGAKGDGITNDDDAFRAMADYININHGGHIIIPKGVYLLGEQERKTSGDLAYEGRDIFSVNNGDFLKIEGHGATLKLKSGLRIGHFNQVTGEPVTKKEDVDQNTKNTIIGNIITIVNFQKVDIEGLELDGQCDEYTKGILAILDPEGHYISAELGNHGLNLLDNKLVHIKNVSIHHIGVDGIYLANNFTAQYSNTFTGYPVTLENVDCYSNGRQGLSWTGGKGLTAISCKFNKTGKDTNGISYEPSAGVDIEPNASMIENGVFINCEFIDNNGMGVLVQSPNQSRDISFIRCELYGKTATSMRIFGKGISFQECCISGEIYESGYSDIYSERTYFHRCLISGSKKYEGSAPFGPRLLNEYYNTSNFTSNPIFDECTFVTGDKGLVNTIESNPANIIVKNCAFIKENSYGSLYKFNFEGNNVITYQGAVIFNNSTNKGKIKWNDAIITDDYCDADGTWHSYTKDLYWSAVDYFNIPDYACSFFVTATELNTNNYIIASGTKQGKGVTHEITTMLSNGLGFGENNPVGKQYITGFTDKSKIRIKLNVFE